MDGKYRMLSTHGTGTGPRRAKRKPRVGKYDGVDSWPLEGIKNLDTPRLSWADDLTLTAGDEFMDLEQARRTGVSTDAITAIIAAILALANALDKKGVLSFEEYRDALLSMYREMPHEDASGDAGHIFDGMLSQLERVIRNSKRQT